MGHHYTPQEHLRRFADKGSPEKIWIYDKGAKTYKLLPIKVVAQEANFYPQDVEIALNEKIEIPGNHAISKLIAATEGLASDQRFNLSAYIVNLMLRGPRPRKFAFESAANFISEASNELRQDLIAQQNPSTEYIVDLYLEQIDSLEKAWLEKLPESAIKTLKTPHSNDLLIRTVFDMTWEIIAPSDEQLFVTSDTPVHYFDGLGISRENSEIVFTVTKNLAIVAHHGGPKNSSRFHRKGNRRLVREINRRILSTTERFIFSHCQEPWIPVLAEKPNLRLNAIRWR